MKTTLPLFGALLIGLVGCASRPAYDPALEPSRFYSDVGEASVGGPMRRGGGNALPRNPPRLPIVKNTPAPSNVDIDSLVEPSSPGLSSSARPATSSPVPAEADEYFTDTKPNSTDSKELGGLFDSIFVPPNSSTPPAPTTTSSASYQTVK